MPLLELEGVSKRFGALTVTDDLSLTLDEGEALGVIGPNGAGKTTMFNLITGDLRPDVGRIRLLGRDITSMKPAVRCRLGIGRTYQIPHPFVGMTVYENTLVGAGFGAGLHEREARDECMALLELTGLAEQANAFAGTLRLLDRKRLELARALATRPRVLLLDEVAGGLTEHEVQALVDTIGTIREGGVSIVWIEHLVHALVSAVDRLIAINFGRLLCVGEPAAVMSSPEVQAVYMGVEGETG